MIMIRMPDGEVDREAVSALCEKLHNRVEFLRYNEWPDREALVTYLGNQIEGMKDMVDLPGGWTDPDDPFAATALESLRIEFAEVTKPGNPYPIAKDDPQPRTESGQVIAPEDISAWLSTYPDGHPYQEIKQPEPVILATNEPEDFIFSKIRKGAGNKQVVIEI